MSIKVNFAAMETAAAELTGSAQGIEASLTELESRLKPLFDAWEGSARDEYYRHQTEWDNAATALTGILNQIGTAVRAAGENYAGAEKANASIWGS